MKRVRKKRFFRISVELYGRFLSAYCSRGYSDIVRRSRKNTEEGEKAGKPTFRETTEISSE